MVLLWLSALPIVAQNEYVVGYCSNELPADMKPVSLSEQEVRMSAAIRLPANKLMRYKGCQLTKIRFAVMEGFENVSVWVRTSLDTSSKVIQSVPEVVTGWNEVTLNRPLTIDGDELYIGYTATQPASFWGILAYGEGNEYTSWLAIGNEWNGVPVRYFENERYLETNNVVSLYKAADFCDDDMLMLECDIYYHKEMLERLLQGEGDCSILVSPFNPLTMDGTVIRVEGDKAYSLILGKWQGENFDYSKTRKTVNMYRFTKDFVKNKYMPLVRWYVECMGENSYYEKVLGSLMYYRECDFRIVEVPEEMWCEIDDEYDLKRARARFGK